MALGAVFAGGMAVVAVGSIALAAGPIGLALLVMIGVPLVMLGLLRTAGHASTDNPHFASPRPIAKP